MRKTRRTTLSVVLALGASVLLAVVAAASSTYTDKIAGWELPNATATVGQFVGTATGPLPGAWYAVVVHDPLSGGPASIRGGSFKLSTAIHHEAVTVTGLFSGGTVTPITGFDGGCTNQTYKVAGLLKDVGINGGSGTGQFNATLTHYRAIIWWLGGCVTYWATVTGTVGLTPTP